jgi:ketosteroid isomerase-like protein
MRKTVVCSLLLLGVILAAGCPAKQGPAPVLGPPPTPDEVVAAIKKQVEQYRQGYEVRSLEALTPLYAQTDELVLTVQGRSAVGWSLVKDGLKGLFETMSTIKLRIGEVSVVALGDGGAVATVRLVRVYGDGVTTSEETGTLTLVFRRVGADWQIVTEHFSYAPVVQ